MVVAIVTEVDNNDEWVIKMSKMNKTNTQQHFFLHRNQKCASVSAHACACVPSLRLRDYNISLATNLTTDNC